MRDFDATRPALTRDGHPVTIWRRRDRLLMGAIHLGRRRYQACTWGERSGLRVETSGPTGSDLVNAPDIVDPHEFDRLRGLYETHDLYSRCGVRFDTFLLSPDEILEAVRSADPDMAPLLPSQSAAMHAQVEAELVPHDARLRGGGYMQPMRHHSYAISVQRVNR